MNKLRVWYIRNVPGKATYFAVSSVKEAQKLIDKMAAKDLKDPSCISNVFGLQQLVNGEWEEWHDEKGRDIDEI